MRSSMNTAHPEPQQILGLSIVAFRFAPWITPLLQFSFE